MKPKWLRGLTVTRVALCTDPANPAADIVLWKMADESPAALRSDDGAVIAKTRASRAALRDAIQETWRELDVKTTEDDPNAQREAVAKACATQAIVKYSTVRALHKRAAAAYRRDHPGATAEKAMAETMTERLDPYEEPSPTNPTFVQAYRVSTDDARVGKALDLERDRDSALAIMEAEVARVVSAKGISKGLAYGELLGRPTFQKVYADYVAANQAIAKMRGRA